MYLPRTRKISYTTRIQWSTSGNLKLLQCYHLIYSPYSNLTYYPNIAFKRNVSHNSESNSGLNDALDVTSLQCPVIWDTSSAFRFLVWHRHFWRILACYYAAFNSGLPGCFFMIKFRVCAFGWTWIGANAVRQWKTEGPGILRSMGSRRVRHNVATEHQCAFGRGTVYAMLCPLQCIISGDTWFYSVLFLVTEATVKSGQVSSPSLRDSSNGLFTLPQFCG